MTREDIIKMAHEAQLVRFEGGELEGYQLGQASPDDHSQAYWSIATPEKLELFAALIEERIHTNNKAKWYQEGVESERDACIRLCDSRNMGDGSREDQEARRIASEIRARGQS